MMFFAFALKYIFFSSAVSVMHSIVTPIFHTLCLIAGMICTAFLVNGGIQYITSSGRPVRMLKSKKIIRDSLLGLVIILGAASLTAVLMHSYGSYNFQLSQHLPILKPIKPVSQSLSLVDVLVKAITGLFQYLINSIGNPLLEALAYFTKGTPLMTDSSSVFKLWVAMVGMADILFVLVVCLVGFHVMSSSTLGLNELDINHIIPQFALIFLLINSSIFVIDAVINLSNGMIFALSSNFKYLSVWSSLEAISNKSQGMGLAAVLIMLVFLVLVFILLIYYVGRIVTLYLGAVLSPLILLLWLLPSFRDFATNAVKTYITTIFVIFVHVIILVLAASILDTVTIQPSNNTNPLMSLVVGMSTLLALIKTQGVMAQLNYASVGTKSVRRLSTQLINSFSHGKFKAG